VELNLFFNPSTIYFSVHLRRRIRRVSKMLNTGYITAWILGLKVLCQKLVFCISLLLLVWFSPAFLVPPPPLNAYSLPYLRFYGEIEELKVYFLTWQVLILGGVWELRTVHTKYQGFCTMLGLCGKSWKGYWNPQRKTAVAIHFFEIISLESQQKCWHQHFSEKQKKGYFLTDFRKSRF